MIKENSKKLAAMESLNNWKNPKNKNKKTKKKQTNKKQNKTKTIIYMLGGRLDILLNPHSPKTNISISISMIY